MEKSYWLIILLLILWCGPAASNKNSIENNFSFASTPTDTADLSIALSVSSGKFEIGDSLDFEVTATNNGPGDVEGWALNWNAGGPFPQRSGGAFSRLLVGESETVKFRVHFTSSGFGSFLPTVSSPAVDPNPVNNSAKLYVLVRWEPIPESRKNKIADLELDLFAPQDSILIGDTLAYTVNIKNHGPDEATNVWVYFSQRGGLELKSISSPLIYYENPSTNVFDPGSISPGETVTFQLNYFGRRIESSDFGIQVFANEIDMDSKNDQKSAFCYVRDGTLILSNTYNISPQKMLEETVFDYGIYGEKFKVCADGSKSTFVQFVGLESSLENLEFKLYDYNNPDENNPLYTGELNKLTTKGDTITYEYTHPELVYPNAGQYHEILLDVKNMQSELIIKRNPIHVYRAPVVMVHGLWADRKSFESLNQRLVSSNQWMPELTHVVDYSRTNDRFFQDNRFILPYHISETIEAALNNDYSVGKVNVVGHSMGGILTRQYIQSDGYFDDICRIITLNTPHSGSQLANFLIEYKHSIGWLLSKVGMNSSNGAVEDLRVNSEQIFDLNRMQPNTDNVPKHAIVTLKNVNEFSQDFINFLMTTRYFMEALLYQTILFNLSDVVDSQFLENVFNTPQHDLIVAASSQAGGIANETLIVDQAHMGAAANIAVMDKVMQLLNADPSDPQSFSRGGYNPPKQTYNFSGLRKSIVPKKYLSNGKIQILSPANEKSVLPGEVLSVSFEAENDIHSVLLLVGGKNIAPVIQRFESVSGILEYTVPMEASDKINILALGKTNDGTIYQDSAALQIVFDSSVESIRIEPGDIWLNEGGKFPISIMGNFADGYERDLSNNPELNIFSQNTEVALINENRFVQAIKIDTTKVIAEFQGKVDRINVAIVPERRRVGIYEDKKQSEGQNTKPERFSLRQNYPNPFNSSTTIQFMIQNDAFIQLYIYNILGQKIKVLSSQKLSAGSYSVKWDGLNTNGHTVSNGVYFYKLIVDDHFQINRKLILLK